jgi:hypothetical protein
MIDHSPEAYRKELASLSQRLQAVNEEFREHGMSDTHRAVLDRVHREKDRLAMMLSDAEHTGTKWNLIKAEFAAAFNSFVADLELLQLPLLDVESTKKRKGP